METDIVHIPAKVALVQLIDDPERTVLYIPSEAFRDPLEPDNPQQFNLCLYAPHNNHLPWPYKAHDGVPVVQQTFNRTSLFVVYNVRVLDVVTTAIDDRPSAIMAPHTSSTGDVQLLDCVRKASTLQKPKEIAASVQTIHDHLLRHQCTDALAAHLPELLDTLLYHFYKYAADVPAKCQAMTVTALAYFQIVDAERRTRYAHRVMLMLSGNAGGPNGQLNRIGTRAKAYNLWATMRWLEGGGRRLCAVADVMAQLSAELVLAVPKSHGAPSDWWMLQAAIADALGLLVTLVPAAHVCHMWRSVTPMMPSLTQLLVLMRDSRRLEVRIRVAVLIIVILEKGRRHDTNWFADRMQSIRETFASTLSGTKFMKVSDLTTEDRLKMEMVLRCLKNDLRPEPQHIGSMHLTTWAAQQQYEALNAIFGEYFETQLHENVLLKQIAQLIG